MERKEASAVGCCCVTQTESNSKICFILLLTLKKKKSSFHEPLNHAWYVCKINIYKWQYWHAWAKAQNLVLVAENTSETGSHYWCCCLTRIRVSISMQCRIKRLWLNKLFPLLERNSCGYEPSKIPKCCYMLYIQLYTSKCNVTMSKLFLCCMEQWHYYLCVSFPHCIF